MKRIIELDLLRILALIFVIFHHSTWWFVDKFPSASHYLKFFYLGDLGVSFFIILSGCALTISGAKSDSSLNFYKKRFLSILPPYWIAYLLVAILIFCINGSFFNEFHLRTFLPTVFGMDGWLGTAGYKTYYLVGEWFTGFILLVYAIAPIVIYLVKKKPFLSIIFFTAISYLSIHFNSEFVQIFTVWSHNAFWNPTSRLAEFSVGILLGLLILNNKLFEKSFVFLTLSGIATGILLYFSEKFYDGLKYLFYIALFIFLLTLFNFLKQAFSSAIKIKEVAKEFIPVISFFSSLSFLAFLFHHQLILLIMQRIPGGENSSAPLVSYGLLVCATFCLSYALAHFALPLVLKLKQITKRIIF